MKPEYALARSSRRGYITYWNGRYTKAGVPSVTTGDEEAKKFPTARAAYEYARPLKGLDYFHAVRLYCRNYDDGFITEWWMPEEG